MIQQRCGLPADINHLLPTANTPASAPPSHQSVQMWSQPQTKTLVVIQMNVSWAGNMVRNKNNLFLRTLKMLVLFITANDYWLVSLPYAQGKVLTWYVLSYSHLQWIKTIFSNTGIIWSLQQTLAVTWTSITVYIHKVLPWEDQTVNIRNIWIEP